LVREGLDQLNLRFGERPYGCAVQDEQTYWNPLSQKRHAEDCPIVAESCGFKESVFRISKNIWNLNGFAMQQDAPDYTTAPRCKRLSL
jgi:hypothetical protein